MRTSNYEIIFPDVKEQLEQDEEWLMIDYGNRLEKIRFHDYGTLYDIPGLYEELFYNRLKCNSPKVICDLMSETLEESELSREDLRVLDFGAGNGMVGELIREKGCDLIVGIDILPEAQNAAYRDRPSVYDDYFVMDLNQLDKDNEELLTDFDFNALVTVAALGFGDIPPAAFFNAFNLIEDDGLIAFNIKDKFLSDEDNTGYKEIFKKISKDHIEIHQREEYCHRLSLDGNELNYTALVGTKIKDVNLDIFNY